MPLGFLPQIGLRVVLPLFLSKALYEMFPPPTSWTSGFHTLNSLQTILTDLMTSVHCRQEMLICFLCQRHFFWVLPSEYVSVRKVKTLLLSIGRMSTSIAILPVLSNIKGYLERRHSIIPKDSQPCRSEVHKEELRTACGHCGMTINTKMHALFLWTQYLAI